MLLPFPFGTDFLHGVLHFCCGFTEFLDVKPVILPCRFVGAQAASMSWSVYQLGLARHAVVKWREGNLRVGRFVSDMCLTRV